MTIKNIIFDLDGTLIDSAPSILDSIKFVTQSKNIVLKNSLDKTIVGPPIFEILARITLISDPDLLDELRQEFINYYDSYGLLETIAFPGVNNLLPSLKKSNHKLYIATNKRSHAAKSIVKNLIWDDYFEKIYTLDFLDNFTESNKDKKTLLSKLIENEKIITAEALYIGDRLEDFEASESNGIRFVHASWGYGREKFAFEDTICNPLDLINYIGSAC